MNEAAERREWTDADFDQLGWHDVHIHGLAAVSARFELHLDIDYITTWMCAPSGGGATQFLIAPATMTFENVQHVRIAVSSEQGILSIDEVRRENMRIPPSSSVSIWDWVLKCHEGNICFEASGFHLVLRHAPILSELQYLESARRGPPAI
jgi:hypothetical protein